MSTNFRDRYHLTDFLDANSILPGPAQMRRAVRSMTFRPTEGDGFRVDRVRKGQPVKFSYDGYRVKSDNVMLLSLTEEGKETPIVALRFDVLNRNESLWWRSQAYGTDHLVIVHYTQTTRDPTQFDTHSLETYQRLQEVVGERPHEFLFAQFLGRLAPGLDRFPDAEVFYRPYREKASSFKGIRDRFLEKRRYGLNPNKARVRDILGPDNAWLEARQ